MATTGIDRRGDELDPDALRRWLGEVLGEPVTALEARKLDGGHSSGAWRVDLRLASGARALVVKAPVGESVVYQRDPCREGQVLADLHRAGAPVPAVVAIDAGGALGRPCIVMDLVAGRSPDDASLAGYHDDPELQAAGPEAQRLIWGSFYDALARLHSVDGRLVPSAGLPEAGLVGVVHHWRAALLDVAPAEAVPRQLAVLDWLQANLPPGADDDPAVCMGDARLVNCLFDGTDATALVDFEVAYLGHPAADVGYSCFIDAAQRANAAAPLPGVGSTDEAWARWAQATGRDIAHRDYWTSFGAMVLCVTATRAMVQWGLAGPSLESDNPVVPAWEAAVQAALP